MHINRHAGPTASITRDVQKLELIELMMFEMFFRGFFQGGEPNIVRTGLALYSSMMAVELSAHDCHDATQRRSLQAVVDAVASIVKLEMVEMESRLKAELLSIQLPVIKHVAGTDGRSNRSPPEAETTVDDRALDEARVRREKELLALLKPVGLLFALFFVYIFLGGLVFVHLEAPHEL